MKMTINQHSHAVSEEKYVLSDRLYGESGKL